MSPNIGRGSRTFNDWVLFQDSGPAPNPNALRTEDDLIMQTESGEELEVE